MQQPRQLEEAVRNYFSMMSFKNKLEIEEKMK